jgi:hypothetical protein
MSTIYTPPEHIRAELDTLIRRQFPHIFADTNIHPCPMDVSFKNKKGAVTASATLRWQRQPDYKDGQHVPEFSYLERRGVNGREMYWYCTSGLPDM